MDETRISGVINFIEEEYERLKNDHQTCKKIESDPSKVCNVERYLSIVMNKLKRRDSFDALIERTFDPTTLFDQKYSYIIEGIPVLKNLMSKSLSNASKELRGQTLRHLGSIVLQTKYLLKL